MDTRLTKTQAAALAAVSEHTIARWIARGLLPAARLPTGRLAIDEQDVRALLRGTPVLPAAPHGATA